MLNQQLISILFELDYLILLALLNLPYLLGLRLLRQLLWHLDLGLFGANFRLALIVSTHPLPKHLVFILHLPEPLFDDLDFVVTLLYERTVPLLELPLVLELLLHGNDILPQLLDLFFFFARDFHELPSLLLLFLQSFPHVKQL